ncbi:amidohydrolase family protein [Opitutaceae bacterium]|nr:amidohydrolase family protein [Opitutaceae bacterium]
MSGIKPDSRIGHATRKWVGLYARQRFTGRLIAALVDCSSAGIGSLQGHAQDVAFVSAKIIDGTGAAPIERGILVIRDGRISAVGEVGKVKEPQGAVQVDVSGKVIMPGLINGHGHIGGTVGLQGNRYSRENVLRDLRLNARYGVTTVASLGGDEAASVAIREAEKTLSLDRARLRVAGPVVVGKEPEAAMIMVSENIDLGVDFIKIKVDGAVGSRQRMSKEVFTKVTGYSQARGVPVASHLYYLDDARELVAAGVDYIAHSIRDRIVDDAFIAQAKAAEVYYCPTLMRDVSTYIYESEPEFFADPLFLAEMGPGILDQLRDPKRQASIRSNQRAQANKEALRVALVNLKKLADADVPIVMGTDGGPPGRFQGYFEHLEMEMMVEQAGLSPMQVIVAATGGAAGSLQLTEVGTLEPGKWADFIVLAADPLVDIANTRSFESVWIAGNQVP